MTDFKLITTVGNVSGNTIGTLKFPTQGGLFVMSAMLL